MFIRTHSPRRALGVAFAITLAASLPAAAQAPDPHRGHHHDVEPVPVSSALRILEDLNPRVSAVADFVASWSNTAGRRAGADGLSLRGVEVGLDGAIDDVVSFRGAIFADEDEIELEEAFVVTQQPMPVGFSLRVGRYNTPFGILGAAHDHELPTLDKPSMLQEYVGGTVRGTGLELRWRAPLGPRANVRLHVSVLQSADSDAHVVLGPAAGHGHADEDDDDEGPVREIEDFAAAARLLSTVELSDAVTLSLGTSFLHAPSRVFGVDDNDDRDVDHEVFGLDAAIHIAAHHDADDATRCGFTLQGEWVLNTRDFGTLDDGGTPGVPGDDTFSVATERASGFYFLAECRPAAAWAIGATVNFYEHAENARERSNDVGAYVTYHVNAAHRLRFEVRTFDDLAFEDEGVERELNFVAFAVQWTVTLGGHHHHHDHHASTAPSSGVTKDPV